MCLGLRGLGCRVQGLGSGVKGLMCLIAQRFGVRGLWPSASHRGQLVFNSNNSSQCTWHYLSPRGLC